MLSVVGVGIVVAWLFEWCRVRKLYHFWLLGKCKIIVGLEL